MGERAARVDAALKVALVHPKFDRSGGAEVYASGLAEGLAAAGHEVHLFARRAEGLRGGLALHRVPALPLGRAFKTYSFNAVSCLMLRATAFDVVQGFGKTTCQTVHRTGGGVHRAFLERQGGRSRSLYDRVAIAIEDRLFASATLRAVICPSRWVAREVEGFYPGSASRIRVIPNGVDTARFSPEGRDGDRRALFDRLQIPSASPALLFVGTNFPLKGLDVAVDALAHLPAAHLIVAGGDHPGPFESRAGAAGMAGRVHFLGAVRDPAPLYRAADILLHPTRYDPFANVCLEAWACGTPFVTTDGNGASDLLEGEKGGIAVPVSAGPEAFGAAVKSILGRGEECHSEARSLALAHDQARHLEQVLAVYAQAAGARSADFILPPK